MLIQVTPGNRKISGIDEQRAHEGAGVLHRAFSVFVSDGEGCVLVQQRSARKRLWPGYWSNSFCSHPRWGEGTRQAALRRAPQELGFSLASLNHLYDFEYSARYLDVGSEHELCTVYLARVPQRPEVAAVPDEVSDWRWMSIHEIDQSLANESRVFTPWFLLEWPFVRGAI